MTRQERLERLRQLRIERQEDDHAFESQSACWDWIDKVAPLLKHDQRHYQNFQHNAWCLRRDLSATRLMTHLDAMISTVNQAIAELETAKHCRLRQAGSTRFRASDFAKQFSATRSLLQHNQAARYLGAGVADG